MLLLVVREITFSNIAADFVFERIHLALSAAHGTLKNGGRSLPI